MISVFQIFKIILGTIIGIFFLYFLLNFTGLYSGFQEEAIDLTHLNNLRNTMRSVFVSDTDIDLDMKVGVLYRPPNILGKTRKSRIPLQIPHLFFLKDFEKDEKVIVYKSSIDQGFFDLDFVGVLPETKVLFNPVIQEAKTYSILNKLTKVFPNTNKPEIRFGFCNGSFETKINANRDELINDYTGVLEDQSILDQIKDQLNFQLCTARFTNKIVVIIGVDKFMENGVVLKPSTKSVGEILFIEDGQEKILTYKDELDVLAVILGGEDAYRYKNRVQLKILEIATRKEAERMEQLSVIYLDPLYEKMTCSQLYSDSKTLLAELNSKVKTLQNEKIYQISDLIEFNNNMDQIKEKYEELVNEGCE